MITMSMVIIKPLSFCKVSSSLINFFCKENETHQYDEFAKTTLHYFVAKVK